MIWAEQKQGKKLYYKTEGVFGIIELYSDKKIVGEQLDDIFVAIFEASKGSSAETIEGNVEGMDNVNYKFKKTNQWIMEEKEQPQKYTKEHILADAEKFAPDEAIYKITAKNMIKKLKNIIAFYKESHKLDSLLGLESDKYLSYREGATERDVIVKREGKDVTIKESELWEGQRFGSQEAIDFLSTKYKDLWEIAKERESQKKKCDVILAKTFGFDLNEMSPFKLLKLVETFTILFVLPTLLLFSVIIIISLII